MRTPGTDILLDRIDDQHRSVLADLRAEVSDAVLATDWPHGSGDFAINPGVKRNANGVVPIKKPFMQHLATQGWIIEKGWETGDTGKGSRPGDIDAYVERDGLRLAVEWETGNVSSSHRSANKILLGLLDGRFDAGILILPDRRLARYLTDRIGNLEEIEEYKRLWRAFPLPGFMEIMSVSYDRIDTRVPLIPKGQDGNAKPKPVDLAFGSLFAYADIDEQPVQNFSRDPPFFRYGEG